MEGTYTYGYEAETNVWDAVETAAPGFFSGIFSLFGGSAPETTYGSAAPPAQEDQTQQYIMYAAIALVILIIVFLIVKAAKK